MALTPKQRLFVEEYVTDWNATRAAKAAGYSERTAAKQGSDNLQNPHIAAEVERRMAARIERIHATQDDIMETLSAWTLADPRELVQHVRVCCRFCNSPNGLYQEKPSERHARKAKHDRTLERVPMKEWAGLPQFDELGGLYDPRKPINPECVECGGDGDEKTVVTDTRKLSKGAAMLYGGVKVTAQGLELKMQPKDKAVEMLARHYGIVGSQEKGDPTAPRKILLVNDPDDL